MSVTRALTPDTALARAAQAREAALLEERNAMAFCTQLSGAHQHTYGNVMSVLQVHWDRAADHYGTAIELRNWATQQNLWRGNALWDSLSREQNAAGNAMDRVREVYRNIERQKSAWIVPSLTVLFQEAERNLTTATATPSEAQRLYLRNVAIHSEAQDLLKDITLTDEMTRLKDTILRLKNEIAEVRVGQILPSLRELAQEALRNRNLALATPHEARNMYDRNAAICGRAGALLSGITPTESMRVLMESIRRFREELNRFRLEQIVPSLRRLAEEAEQNVGRATSAPAQTESLSQRNTAILREAHELLEDIERTREMTNWVETILRHKNTLVTMLAQMPAQQQPSQQQLPGEESAHLPQNACRAVPPEQPPSQPSQTPQQPTETPQLVQQPAPPTSSIPTTIPPPLPLRQRMWSTLYAITSDDAWYTIAGKIALWVLSIGTLGTLPGLILCGWACTE